MYNLQSDAESSDDATGQRYIWKLAWCEVLANGVSNATA
jgi:hypothetical protein